MKYQCVSPALLLLVGLLYVTGGATSTTPPYSACPSPPTDKTCVSGDNVTGMPFVCPSSVVQAEDFYNCQDCSSWFKCLLPNTLACQCFCPPSQPGVAKQKTQKFNKNILCSPVLVDCVDTCSTTTPAPTTTTTTTAPTTARVATTIPPGNTTTPIPTTAPPYNATTTPVDSTPSTANTAVPTTGNVSSTKPPVKDPEEDKQTPGSFPWYWILVGVVPVVAGVIGGVIYYRKKKAARVHPENRPRDQEKASGSNPEAEEQLPDTDNVKKAALPPISSSPPPISVPPASTAPPLRSNPALPPIGSSRP